jgi:hypothetical protein
MVTSVSVRNALTARAYMVGSRLKVNIRGMAQEVRWRFLPGNAAPGGVAVAAGFGYENSHPRP